MKYQKHCRSRTSRRRTRPRATAPSPGSRLLYKPDKPVVSPPIGQIKRSSAGSVLAMSCQPSI
ncbi:MAG TPA: hypothetical protein VK459_23225, partial [Polyangiaceae bacterium]|nr:hypothetical protein [Polyangiaceae bacterium]